MDFFKMNIENEESMAAMHLAKEEHLAYVLSLSQMVKGLTNYIPKKNSYNL